MFNVDLSSKRVRLALRFFSYGAMTVVTVLGTITLVFFAMGYRFDNNFKFVQGGLVQFNSFPSNAGVTIDNMQQNFHTPGNANLAAGSHRIDLSLSGYQTWSKTIDLAAGQLLWLSYARLIPNKISTSSIREFDDLSGSLVSPGKQWIILQPHANVPDFVLADVSNPRQPKFSDIQVPDSQLVNQNGQLGSFSLVEWDSSSQYILVEQQNGSTTSFIRLDRSDPSQSINISTKFGFTMSEAHFALDNSNVIFANTEGVLRRLDIGSGSASDVLVDNLQQFVVQNNNQVAFVSTEQQPTPNQVVGLWQNSQVVPLRYIPINQQIKIAYSNYEGHYYFAIATSQSTKVDILRDPSSTASPLFAQLDLGAPVQWLLFSPGSHMLVAQNANKIAVFDFEQAKSY